MIESVSEQETAEVPDGVVFGIRGEEGGEEREGVGGVIRGADGGEDARFERFVLGYGLLFFGEGCRGFLGLLVGCGAGNAVLEVRGQRASSRLRCSRLS